MYRNDNTARKINQDFVKKQKKIIKIKKQNKTNKLKNFYLVFSTWTSQAQRAYIQNE